MLGPSLYNKPFSKVKSQLPAFSSIFSHFPSLFPTVWLPRTMEIEAKDGTTTIPLNQTSTTDFGRGLGFNNTNDRTVSRRHVTFKPQSESEFESMVRFEVIGKNPMWVRSGRNGETKFFRSGDEGEMEGGDLFCVSGKTPVWFGLKRIKGFGDEVFERLETTSSSSNGASVTSFEPVDVSDTDPVKEFGFLVMGHEFDCYSKQMIRDMKNWNWFLEEARKGSDDEDVSEKKGRRSVKKNRKNARGIDDDDDDDDDGEWTGESEDDKELVSKLRKFPRPNYSTRSKDCSSKPPHDSKNSKKYVHKKSLLANEEENEEEDEETLGGFIVDEEDVEREEESEEDEEEEFDEDDNDEEIND